jgi:predicted metal-binding membrane protein
MTPDAVSSASPGNAVDRPRLPVREQLTLFGGLAAISGLSWLYLIRMPMVPSDFGTLGARLFSVLPPGLANFWFTFMMWAVMMVAMMLPSAGPMILMYAAIARRHRGTPAYAAWVFAGAYVLVWTAFSAGATIAQLMLVKTPLLENASQATWMTGAVLLVLAGLYQLTPIKSACLAHCRSPIGFFMTEWRDGITGAFAMGIKHGTQCLGCCWMLMGLLFVFGVMNLMWVAALSVFVLLEKVAPFGHRIALASGVAMLATSIALVVYH